MSKAPDAPMISSLVDLLAVAYQIEADAVDRYDDLAAQMEVHNNKELVAVFRNLARAEAIHRDEILRLGGDDVATHARAVAKWNKGESPEEADMGAVHYLMKPWHALQLALAAEQRALAFFASVAETTTNPTIKKMAEEFAEEEAEHVQLVNRLLVKHPKPTDTWSDDLDPPQAQD